MSGSIPKVIHRIWLGDSMPPEEAELAHRWQALHRAWTVRTWRDWDMPALLNQDLYDQAAHPSEKADIARYEILHRYGGVYVDTDVEPQRPLDELIAAVDAFFGAEDSKWVGTAIIGAVPGHPFMADLVDGLRDPLTDRSSPINERTGPKYVTARLQDWHRRHPDGGGVVIFPPAFFYPYHFSEPERSQDEFPDAYAVHRWSGSWTN